MALFAGLFSLVGLSLFLARWLRRSSALMPLLAAALAMLWFTLCGVTTWPWAIQVGGYIWYAGCLAALVWVLIKEKKRVFALFTPGLVFFLAGGVFFIVLFGATQPMLTLWDEFTFWGTAGKAVHSTGQLYTVADSSLIARSYPPGLILFSTMMQFWGPFTEAGFIAAFAIFYLPAFSAASALWGKNKTGAVVFLAAMFLLPILFEPSAPDGQMMYAYLWCLADIPMAVFFGGALCFYFAGGERGGRLLVPLAVILAALVNLKDMGLALALIVWAVVLADLIFCERERMALFGLRRWKALLAWAGLGLAAIAGSYGLWALHLNLGAGINRFDVGNSRQSLGQLEMLLAGFRALLGVESTPQFDMVLPKMLRAMFTERITLVGSGAVVLGVVLVLSIAAWVLSPTRRQRRRVLVFTVAMGLGFAAFYVFNIFTYAFIFSEVEASVLKHYARYISPYWVGWLMGTMTLLSNAATNEKSIFLRLRAARGVCLAATAALLAVVMLRGNWQANFLHISPALYGMRESVGTVGVAARANGMAAGDVVYIISQWDDGTRFYVFGLDLPAVRVKLFAGPQLDGNGQPVLDEADLPVYAGNATGTLAPPDLDPGAYEGYQIPCSPQQFTAYLRQTECTHVLLDRIDGYIQLEFADLFADKLEGWDAEDPTQTGHRYYKVEWDEAGTGCTLVPQMGGVVG